jgi:hypothetical protein
MKRLGMILVFLLLTAFAVSAQDSTDDAGNLNDPLVNERANACYEGGSWEGKCGDDEYLWIAGWYYIRLEAGLLTAGQVPSSVEWIVPTCVAINDLYDANVGGPNNSISTPSLLANDSCQSIISYAIVSGPVTSLTVNSDGTFSYTVSRPGTFVFVYVTESGAVGTVTVNHDLGHKA